MFKWFKNKPSLNHFHGVDLNHWHYVGYTRIHYQDEFGANLANAFVNGFVHKNNFEIRQYKIVNGAPGGHTYSFDTHEWVTLHAKLWKIGERALWTIAQDEPSRWLVDYMKKTHNHIWEHDTKNWFKIADTPVIEYQEGSNVVHLEFKKPDDVAG